MYMINIIKYSIIKLKYKEDQTGNRGKSSPLS